MHSRYKIFFLLLAITAALTACSTKKNKPLNRFWHGLNTRYNGYFNGNEAMKTALTDLSKSKRDNYNKIIPVFDYGDRTNWQTANANSDRAITKAVIMIKKHSMFINGKQYNRWIDDCYLLMGKAHFFKIEHDLAANQLRYVTNNSEKQATKDEARIWMIKTYSEKGEFAEASIVNRQIKKDQLPDKLKWEYYAALADFHIRQKEYEKAIENLDEAIHYQKKKKRKARLEFVKGQLYQELKNDKLAYESFNKVLKLRPEYELEFQSKLSLAKTAGDENNEELKKLLRKMLRDDKNLEYRDQIYYALGIVEMKEGNKTEAIASFKESVRYNVDNKNQKALSFLQLAEIYLKDRSYEPAQAYYDSTSTVLEKDHPKYDEVLRLKDNLTEVVMYIRTVSLQDSLQRLSAMSDTELESYFTDYVEKLKEEDAKRLEELSNNPGPGMFPQNTGTGQGQFYFTNAQTLAFGLGEFKKLWGNRPLEDDWRRSNKSTNAFTGVDDSAGVEKYNPRYDVALYVNGIPRGDSALAASNAMIYDALYGLGLVYKEKIYDNERSAEAFEELAKRNTNNRHFPVAYYQLYLVYTAMKDEPNALKYKSLILQRYPDSEYADLLNGKFRQDEEEKNDKAEPLYQAAYLQYKDGFYSSCMQSCKDAAVTYPESNLLHRFALLNALCIGKTDSSATADTFRIALQNVITAYPGSESAETADRLLKALSGTTAGTNGTDVPPVTTKGGQVSSLEQLGAFNFKSDAEHLMILLIPDLSKKTEPAIAAINAFNDKNFSLSLLSTNVTLMGNTYQLLSIRKFKGAVEAENYYNAFKGSGIAGNLGLGDGIKFFPISTVNYSVLFKQQNIAEYELFLKKNYKLN